jgi:hypothetical protein
MDEFDNAARPQGQHTNYFEPTARCYRPPTSPTRTRCGRRSTGSNCAPCSSTRSRAGPSTGAGMSPP